MAWYCDLCNEAYVAFGDHVWAIGWLRSDIPVKSRRRSWPGSKRSSGSHARVVLFVAPGMIAHYVEHHGYAPPAEFVAAVMTSPPGTAAYGTLVERFRQVHKQWSDELMRRHGILPQD